MKIFSADQIREADRYTIEHEPIASIDLMERASKAFVSWFIDKFPKPTSITVVCGTGNNGGDGLVITRLLKLKGWDVKAFIVNMKGKQSDDFKTNYLRAKEIVDIRFINDPSQLSQLDAPGNIVIDAIFGSGLTRAVSGIYQQVIEKVNQLDCIRVSVDIPSGMFCDKSSRGNAIVASNVTVAFQFPKPAFFVPENAAYCPQWEVVNIGLHNAYIKKNRPDYYLVEPGEIPQDIKTRDQFSHKGSVGNALIIAGSYGKIVLLP